jgi:hypothetical protein
VAINKKLYLLLPLSALFIILTHHFFNENTFLYDDAPESLSYFDSTSKSCPNELGFIKRSSFPKLVLNLSGNCFPLLHTERTGAFAFNIIHLFNSFLSKKDSLTYFKAIISLFLLILYLNLTIKFSSHLKISPTLTTLLFFFSPYFFFLYEPYLVEKMIPLAIVIIHLVLFSKAKRASFLAGLLCAFFMFFIKITFLFELIPVWILHFLYFKRLSAKKYALGFILGLLPLLVFNFAMFVDSWMLLTQDITVYSNSFLKNIPLFLEFIFTPSSFYINGLFYKPEYLELTEYLPFLVLGTSLTISITYSVKKKESFVPYLIFSFLLCFFASYLLVMSKAKDNSIIYISSLGLYIPLLINFGFTKLQRNKQFFKLAIITQLVSVVVFAYTLIFEIPKLEIISNKGTLDYERTSKILRSKGINKLIVDDLEKLNAKYLIPGINLYSPATYNQASLSRDGFGILSADLNSFHPVSLKDSSLKRFNKEIHVINKTQNIYLHLFIQAKSH